VLNGVPFFRVPVLNTVPILIIKKGTVLNGVKHRTYFNYKKKERCWTVFDFQIVGIEHRTNFNNKKTNGVERCSIFRVSVLNTVPILIIKNERCWTVFNFQSVGIEHRTNFILRMSNGVEQCSTICMSPGIEHRTNFIIKISSAVQQCFIFRVTILYQF
jgi:hypothetical protein